jgi:hypothetical protein
MASILSTNVFQNASTNTQNTTETAVPSVTGGTVRNTLGPPAGVAGSQLEGRIIRVNAAAKVTGGTTTNFSLGLYWYNSVNTDLTTFTGDIKIATTAASAVNTTTKMFFITADVVWDATSQRIIGVFEYCVDSAFTARAGTTPATGVVASSNLKFFTTGLFSVGNAGNIHLLTDFSVNLL